MVAKARIRVRDIATKETHGRFFLRTLETCQSASGPNAASKFKGHQEVQFPSAARTLFPSLAGSAALPFRQK